MAKTKIDRFLAAEYDELPVPNAPSSPTLDGDVKVFELSIDEIEHRINARGAPLAALGFNGVWTGPQIRVVEGDRVRAVFTNNLKAPCAASPSTAAGSRRPTRSWPGSATGSSSGS